MAFRRNRNEANARPGAALALTVASTTAWADVLYHEVPVLDVEPIKETVRVVEPEQRCWHEEVRQRPPVEARGATAPLVGALVGGMIGNAVGHNKRNKQVGAVVGALLGGSVGHDIARRNQARDSGVRRIRTVRQEVCETVDRTRTEERVTGHLVTYRYAGETYRSRMTYRPGETIRIRVRVTPA